MRAVNAFVEREDPPHEPRRRERRKGCELGVQLEQAPHHVADDAARDLRSHDHALRARDRLLQVGQHEGCASGCRGLAQLVDAGVRLGTVLVRLAPALEGQPRAEPREDVALESLLDRGGQGFGGGCLGHLSTFDGRQLGCGCLGHASSSTVGGNVLVVGMAVRQVLQDPRAADDPLVLHREHSSKFLHRRFR